MSHFFNLHTSTQVIITHYFIDVWGKAHDQNTEHLTNQLVS